MSSNMPPITIIGAGLSGLTLGACLKNKGIPYIIYDRATSSPRYNYRIVLRSSVYKRLLNVLRMDEGSFRRSTAVDANSGLKEPGNSSTLSVSTSSEFFSCHRGRLEELLRRDLAIKGGNTLKYAQLFRDTKDSTAIFEEGGRISQSCLIGCDGPHSMIRQSLSTALRLEVLPYVVFNGKRKISRDHYVDKIHKYLGATASVAALHNDTRLQISLSDIDDSEATISYTYSRPARGSKDPLHRADRPVTGAKDVPKEFFTELADLTDLQPPFNEVFKVEEIRGDRLLHWLMRIVLPELSEIKRLSESGVTLIGDAVHATPILGGEGANLAIQDGMDLAEHIASKGTADLKAFSEAKFETWVKAVKDSQRRIEEMHSSKASHI